MTNYNDKQEENVWFNSMNLAFRRHRRESRILEYYELGDVWMCLQAIKAHIMDLYPHLNKPKYDDKEVNYESISESIREVAAIQSKCDRSTSPKLKLKLRREALEKVENIINNCRQISYDEGLDFRLAPDPGALVFPEDGY